MYRPQQLREYCFVQDSDCHWFCLPIEFKEEFEFINESEDWELMEKFQKYATGGGINDYVFTNPKRK